MSAKNSYKKQKTTSDQSPNILQNNDDNLERKTTVLHMSSNITEILPEKFKDYNCLHSVVMNKSVQKIGSYAFASCKQLKTVEMTNVKEIDEYSFSCCEKLEQVNGSETCQIFREYCFGGCTELGKIDLSGAEFIEMSGFEDCNNLIDIGDALSVIDIDERAFRGCAKLLNIKLDNVKRIGDRAFEFCEKLNVDGLQKVEKIGESAFAGVPFSHRIVTPPLLTIVERATYYSTDCTAVEITENIRGIHDSAFASNEQNKKVHIDSPYLAIANSAFKYNNALQQITITPNNYCIVLYKSDKYFDESCEHYELTINDTLHTLENVIENHHNTLKEKQQYVISNYDWTVWGNMPSFSSKLKKVIGYDYDSAIEHESTLENVFVNWTSCTRNYGIPSPLLTAVKENMPWEGITAEIFKANPDIVQDIDQSTKLMPFMIAAVGENSSLNSVFSLLIAYPGAINA